MISETTNRSQSAYSGVLQKRRKPGNPAFPVHLKKSFSPDRVLILIFREKSS